MSEEIPEGISDGLRYVVGLQDPKELSKYVDCQDFNKLTEAKEEAGDIFKSEIQNVIIWDRKEHGIIHRLSVEAEESEVQEKPKKEKVVHKEVASSLTCKLPKAAAPPPRRKKTSPPGNLPKAAVPPPKRKKKFVKKKIISSPPGKLPKAALPPPRRRKGKSR